MVVYSIVNNINNKRYIGLTKNQYMRRIKSHINQLNSNKHTNKHLQYAWNKYKSESFSFEILEECASLDEIMYLEKYYIKWFNSMDSKFGYNETSGGESPFLSGNTKQRMTDNMLGKYRGKDNPFYGKSHTQETKQILSKNLKDKENPFKNKKHTEYSKLKIRISKLAYHAENKNPFYGKKHTNEVKQKLSEKHWSKGLFGKLNPTAKKILAISSQNIEICFFSLADAQIFTNCSRGNICSVAKGKWEKTKGWSFSYL